jgi:uncharacterized RDD family membrane protein YckC
MNPTDKRAGRGLRLWAAILDFMIVALVAFVAIWPLGIFENEQAYEPVQLVGRLLTLLVCSYLLVNGWLLLKRGQTLGKRLLGLRIVAYADNKQMSLWLLLIRAFSVLAVLAIPFVGLLVIVDVLFIFTAQRRCLHDYFVGSTVHKIQSDEANLAGV